ncbi:MAG: hypothetical protein ING66_01860 [Rhodocyclaceae bacterium]|jgi:hypothetical protein|nr:hypothetical protein [Rhodocyclaceae bacterium]MCA3059003.1 hypothetical protein [Rhodocyclaceae bacterium]MCA3081835.1 hypothetical protein [Rhodocyclaceae bacterium]
MPTPQVLLKCSGGTVALLNMTTVDHADGVRLCINTPREVWEHVELSAIMPTQCGFLVAATGQAMMAVLPQLKDGCINYRAAGFQPIDTRQYKVALRRIAKYRPHKHGLFVR